MSPATLASIAALAAMLPALAVAVARLAAAIGVRDAVPAPEVLLSADAAVAAVLLAVAAAGAFGVTVLGRIARDSRELLLRARIRDQVDGLPTGASVVDFAIHLDRRHEVAFDAALEPRSPRRPAAREALRELKSRLEGIPSVRRG
jgi:hypothetical protein